MRKSIIVAINLALGFSLYGSLSDGLVAHYKFDGNANDSSGNGNDGVAYDVTLTADRYGNANSAYALNGFSSYIKVANSTSLENVVSNFCVCAWMKSDWGNSPIMPIICKYGQLACLLQRAGSGEPGQPQDSDFYVGAGGVEDDFALNCDVPTDGQWHHWAFSSDGQYVSAYLDGTLVGTGIVCRVVKTGTALLFGTDNTSFVSGSIDDIRIYDHALSATEIWSLSRGDGLVAYYKFDGNANDSSGNGNDGVAYDVTLTTDRYGNANGAYALNGFSSYIKVANSTSLENVVSNFCVCAWMKSDWGNSPIMPIICKYGQLACLLQRAGSGEPGQPQDSDFYVGAGGVEDDFALNCDVPTDGHWHHWAFSGDGQYVNAYLDGTLVGTGIVGRVVSKSRALLIGTDETSYVLGAVDDILIYNRALSATEVNAIYGDGGDPIVSRTVTFDACGGVADKDTMSVTNGMAVGELPTATRDGYDFLGWFTYPYGGEQVAPETVVTADVTWYAQWKSQESEVPTYGPWGEGEDVANPDKLGPTCLQDMALTINGAAGASGDVVAVYRTDTDALCGLGKVLDDSGTLTVMCYAPAGTKLHFKVWIAASGVTEPAVLDCDAKCDLAAPTSGEFYTGHALVVSDDKELALSLKKADWHTASFNVVPDDPSPAAVFADVADKIAAVTQGVNYWMPGKAGTLKQIEVGKGYWVKTTDDDVSWTVSGKTNPSVEIPLAAGWNLIGYAPEDEEAVASVLETALAEDAIDYVTYGVSFYPGGTLTKMTPGKAYWVHSSKTSYTLVYDEVERVEKVEMLRSAKMAASSALGDRTLPKLTTNSKQLTTPTYGPFGESEDVANPDKLGPTMFTDVTLTIDGEPAAVGDCVAAYRGDTGALCGLGKVLETPGALTVVCYVPEGVVLTFKAWTAASGVDDPTIVACGETTAPTAGEIVEETLTLMASTETPTYTVIVGAKASVDVGLKGLGYSTKTLPKGLSYSDKTGLVTGTCKTATAAEGVEVTFTKKNAENIVLLFIARAEDEPTVACEGLDGTTLPLGVTGGSDGIALDIAAETGIKSVTATKLPTGMKLASSEDKTSWYITGAPTKADTYEVAITLTTTAGNKVTKNFTVTVTALPTGATGTFNGFVQKAGAGEGETLNAGTVQVTVSDVGKISAKIVATAGTYSFAATGWDSVNDGIYSVKMTTKKGEMLTLSCDSGAAWNTHQLTGSFTAADGATALVAAQKNAFGKQWFFTAAGDETGGWTLSFAENAKEAALTVSLNADGKTSVAGTLYGAPVTDGKKTTTPSYRVAASGYADVSGIGTGAIFADFAPVISVKSGKTTAKKVLSLRANLWFDRTNEHEEGVGSAAFVQ